MVCLTCLEAQGPLPSFNSVQDNGRSRERMQSSSGTVRHHQAPGNKYSPFPTLSGNIGGSRAGRAGATDISVCVGNFVGASSSSSSHQLHPRLVVSLPPVCDVHGGVCAGDRVTDVRPLPAPLQLHNSRHLTSPPPLSSPSSSSSLPSSVTTDAENDIDDDDDTHRSSFVTFHTRSLPSSTCPSSSSSSSLPSSTYLHLYKQLPQVTSDVDLDRLGRSMRGLQEGRFYYPDLDSDGARSMLRKAPEGTFLVRDSSDPRYLFSVTVKTGRGATSVRIQYQRGFFQLDCHDSMKRKLPRFETLLDLLDFHATVCREQQGAQYRWQESSRRMDLVICLTTPRRHSPPSLAHLARVSVNRSLQDLHLPHRSTDCLPLPDALKQFLRDYPFKV